MNRFTLMLPVVVVLFVFGGLVARGLYRQDEIAGEYRLAARQAMSDKQFEEAKFFYSRLVGSGDIGSPEDRFNWVSLLSASGEQQAARDQLDRLAPIDSEGYGPAHLVKAKMLLASVGSPNVNRSAVLQTVKHHLKHGAWKDEPTNHLLWANYHRINGQQDSAAGRFFAAAQKDPNLWFDLIKVFESLNKPQEVQRARKQAETVARRAIQSDPSDIQARLQLAEILIQREQVEAVRQILLEGLRRDSNEPRLKRAASQFALVQMQRIKDDEPNAEQRRVRLLGEAARFSPNNGNVYQAAQAFYLKARTDDERKAYREALEAMIVEGQSTSGAHFALGNLKYFDGDRKGAIFHFETAVRLDPKAATFANNLAWTLTQKEEGDLDRAEELARQAVEAQPQNTSFKDTLATVLVRKKNFDEALPLLETILPRSSGDKRRKIHANLATTYDALGQPELAQLHRRKSQIEG